jgi:hypothetical protein
VITARKVGMVLVVVMLEQWGPGVQALSAMLGIQLALLLHSKQEPFSYAGQDRLETISLGCSFLCLLGGMVFWTQDVKLLGRGNPDAVSEQDDIASLTLTLAITVLNVSTFVQVVQRVLVRQFRDAFAWLSAKRAAWKMKRLQEKAAGKHLGLWFHVSRAFPSWNRSILTEIYLCHACSYQEILRRNGRG